MTATRNVMPTQWGRYSDIEDVEPLNDRDTECLAAIRDVLSKHGMQQRFGVALLHKHFPMTEDEMLIEHTDKEGRTLVIKPVKAEHAGPTVETIWELGDGNDHTAWLGCRQYCGNDVQGNHNSFHR